MRRRQGEPRGWRGQRPRGHAVERVAGCAFACTAAPAETTARALGATWIWTTGRPRLSQTFAGLGPQAAEVRERVDAGRVAAFECDLERVLTDERHVSDEELFGAERLDARQAPWSAGFTAARSARTRPPQLLGGVCGVLAVFPGHLHRLLSAANIHVHWIPIA